MGRIFIDKLKVFAHHGVLESEKKNGQFFYVSLEIESDFNESAENDELQKTVDYSSVVEFIYHFMTKDNCKLIETVCVRLADALLFEYKRIEAVKLTIFKPDAPIDRDFENVSVTCERRRHRVYLSIGSNMGDKENTLKSAISEIDRDYRCKVLKKSEFIVTKPYGNVEQDDFVNGALFVETFMDSYEFLYFLHNIEANHGRKREIHWGPRTLDLDIIFFDEVVINSEELSIPHIDMHNREFVLKPLCEIAPFKRHPLNGKTVKEMYDDLGTLA